MLVKSAVQNAAGVKVNPKGSCAVCGDGRLEKILDLPNFPLTGIFTTSPCPGRYPRFDQALMLCSGCGHAQLLNVIDPKYLYGEVYSQRSSESAISTQGNNFFAAFLEEMSAGRRFKTAVEVGCNDLYLLGKLEPRCEALFGVDPIWMDKPHPANGKISVIGKFIEEVDWENEVGSRPDLVISAHTFEHLDDPRKHLETLMRFAAEDALFVIEVPALDSLLRAARFDQVFHQHIQYFSVASFVRLIAETGGRYLAHVFNHAYWNGTLLMAFRKGRAGERQDAPGRAEAPTAEKVRRSFRIFQSRMADVMEIVQNLDGLIYGYGAAQMVPTLAYHLGSDLGFLECILDDDPRRQGLFYPDLKVQTRSPGPEIPWSSASVMITAPDSLRPILKRLLQFPVRRVINPVPLF